ncbi:MAG: class I SAM-dependent methyltransferase [Candidatus Megaira endosymbiont of Mesostigma viride]|jgi:SAM-dependent methyltransferase|nr:MAG: class I SAM-dependent methyltransferase [Candidatus Megaira endosymbiont of Mesostigma viride]HJK88455.1 methyltransferase domain-containing protein [Candidatus Megaira endosymbiont of Mesostigma viride]
MLYNNIEKEVMSSAVHPYLRNSNKVVYRGICDIVAGYFRDFDFCDLHILDIGPGQCDFLDIAKAKGAVTYGIDFEPAVVKLGEMRGHNMTLCNVIKDWPFKDMVFDGIFCRGSINCYWFIQQGNSYLLQQFLNQITKSLKPDSWMWIMPWNKPSPSQVNLVDLYRITIEKWASEAQVNIDIFDKDIVNRKERSGYEVFFDFTLPSNEIWTKNCTLNNKSRF